MCSSRQPFKEHKGNSTSNDDSNNNNNPYKSNHNNNVNNNDNDDNDNSNSNDKKNYDNLLISKSSNRGEAPLDGRHPEGAPGVARLHQPRQAVEEQPEAARVSAAVRPAPLALLPVLRRSIIFITYYIIFIFLFTISYIFH